MGSVAKRLNGRVLCVLQHWPPAEVLGPSSLALERQGRALCGEDKLAEGPRVKHHGSSWLKSTGSLFRSKQTLLYFLLLLLDGCVVKLKPTN